MKLHTGSESLLRPSMGAWMSYGLGSENQNLPAFVTLCPTSLHGGVDNFGAAFLPAQHQGVPLGTPGYPNTLAKNARFHYMGQGDAATLRVQREQLSLLRALGNREQRIPRWSIPLRHACNPLNWLTGCRWKPEVTDLSGESSFTRSLHRWRNRKPKILANNVCLHAVWLNEGFDHSGQSRAQSPFQRERDQHSHLEQGHAPGPNR